MQPSAPIPRRVTFDAFNQAWETLRRNIGLYAGSMFLVVLISYVVSLPISLVMQRAMMGQVAHLPPEERIMAMFASPLYWGQLLVNNVIACLIAPFYITLSRMALRSMRGQELNINMLFEFGDKYGQLVLFSFLLALIGGVGFALCLVPGLIFYSAMLPAGLLILERDIGASEAMAESWRAVLPSLGTAVSIILVCACYAIGGLILCFVGMFFLAPVYFCAQAAVYRQLFDDEQRDPGFDLPAGSYYRPPRQ